MKRFISIPNQFKGVSVQEEGLIFSVMIDRNASGFLTIFTKAEELFRRLQAVQDKFKVPVTIVLKSYDRAFIFLKVLKKHTVFFLPFAALHI